jgi:two-component system sensor histidine kinase YesM
MKKKFFRKNLLLFAIPMLVPLIILGSMSFMLTRTILSKSLNRSAIDNLATVQQTFDIIIQESDELKVTFNRMPKLSLLLWHMLSSDTMNDSQYQNYSIMNNFLISRVSAKEYIHSIYLYRSLDRENPRVYSTNHGLTYLKDMADNNWIHEFRNYMPTSDFGIQVRNTKNYAFENTTQEFLTVYRFLSPNLQSGNVDLLVLNLDLNIIRSSLKSAAKQNLYYIYDESGKLIFDINNAISSSVDISHVNLYEYVKPFIIIDDSQYLVTKMTSETNNWTYISLTKYDFQQLGESYLILIVLLVVFLSLVIAFIIAYVITKNSYNYILDIINIFDYAGTKKELPPKLEPKNEYEYITQNIINTFLEQEYFKTELEKRKYLVQALELEALQSQINPHFLFNTLETIKWKSIALTSKPNECTFMMEDLSDILKYSLELPKNNTIQDELQYTKVYLNIMKTRYPDKFDVIWDYPDTLLDHPIIKLVLQPFVENSIYHGIKPSTNYSLIKIKLVQKKNYINIFIFDTGIGMNKDVFNQLLSRLHKNDDTLSMHIGIQNTLKRLQLADIKSTFRIYSKESFGTLIHLRIY